MGRDHTRSGAQLTDGALPTVLLVDDDEAFLNEVGAQLAGEVRSVRAVRCPAEAFAVLEETRIDVIVCARALGDADGLELLEHVRRLRPTVARVLLAEASEQFGAGDPCPAAQAVLSKPCDASSLAALLAALPTLGSTP
jgi:two-component system response regulator RegA